MISGLACLALYSLAINKHVMDSRLTNLIKILSILTYISLKVVQREMCKSIVLKQKQHFSNLVILLMSITQTSINRKVCLSTS